MIKALLLSSLGLNIGLLLGRLSGFVREVFIAATYGVSAQADILVLTLTVPDILVNILMGGALGAVLVPEFTQHPGKARGLLYQSLLLFGTVFLVISAVLCWQSNILVTLLAPGFARIQTIQAGTALGWVIWLMPLTILSGIVTAYLHAQNRFAVASLGTLIINSTIIIGLSLVYLGYGSLQLIVAFVLLGGLLRLLSQLLQVRISWSPWVSLTPSQVNKALFIRYVQVMLSGSALLLFPVIARAMASYNEQGSVALFTYATRLVEFPLTIAVTFLAVVFFPRLTQSFVHNLALHRKLVKYGVQITLGIALIAAIILISLGDAYAQIVYGYGNMDNSRVVLVATLTTIGLIALPLQGLSGFLTAVFNAQKDTKTPLLINGLGLIFFIVISRIYLFGEGLQALMWGMVISYGFICILQLTFLKIKSLNWWQVLFDRTFLMGLVCAMSLSLYISQWIDKLDASAWLSLLLAGLVGLLSLFVMALFHQEFRDKFKVK